ncbi:hypothetical protein D3273_26235 [Lichenibacterium minor]|uniref:Uncharacterized protein n=1 Tax=Lichenibacterium minor TaxID=2316528 RepID=A0A4Q2U2V4_9HYPH|nr:hypothetical protein [Lichenibacterium minor]RYC29016.1 hypothetical protein D3273_26235 [Lichenibacterium minor]
MRTFALYPFRILGALAFAAAAIAGTAAICLWLVGRYAADPLATADMLVEALSGHDLPLIDLIRGHRARLIEEIGC